MGVRCQFTWILQLRHSRQTPSSVWEAEDPCRQPLFCRGGYEHQLPRICARRILDRSDGCRRLQDAFSRALWGPGLAAGDHGWRSSVIGPIVNFPNVIILLVVSVNSSVSRWNMIVFSVVVLWKLKWIILLVPKAFDCILLISETVCLWT